MDQAKKSIVELVVDMITVELRIFTNSESSVENMEASLCRLSCLTSLLQDQEVEFSNPSQVITKLAGLIILVPQHLLEKERDAFPPRL